MKNRIKKVGSLIIGFAMAVQLVSVYAQTEDDGTQADAVQIEVDNVRADRLMKLGAVYYSETAEDLTREITRGEWAKILVKYLQYNSLYSNIKEKPYIDVELDNEYIREIKVIKDLGLAGSTDRLEFLPKAPITIGDAAEMLANALGYNLNTTSSNLKSAAKMRILDGIRKNTAQGAVLDDLYAMLDNCLNIELMNVNMIYEDSELEAGKTETVLSKYYDIAKKRGIITANTYTGLSEAAAAVGQGSICIDNVSYSLRYKNYGNLLGLTVEYYALDGGSGEIVYIEPYKTNTIITFDAEDTDSCSEQSISYYNDDNKLKKASLSSDIDVIYNRKAYSGYGSLKNIIPDEGQITLYDNDGDSKFDVMLISEYKYYHVKSVDTKSECVYDSFTNEKLDFSSDGKDIEVYNSENMRVAVSGIKKDAVISVAESKNTDGTKLISIYQTTENITGTLISMDEDYAVINDTEYKYSQGFSDMAKAGDSGIFYLNCLGKLVFYKADTSGSWKIGLLYKVLCNTDEDDKIMMNIYTTEGDFVMYNVAEKVNVNSTTANPTGVGGDEYVYKNAVPGEAIRYMLNKDGEIYKLQFADKGTTLSSGEKVYQNELSLRELESGTQFYLRYNMFNGTFAKDANTVIFMAPPEEKWDDRNKFYTSMSLASDGKNYSYPYTAYVYDESEISVADILVIRAETSQSISIEAPLYIISSIEQVDMDGELEYKLTGFERGKRSTYYCEKELFDQFALKKHDVIQFEADRSGEIGNISKVWNADSDSSVSAVITPGTKHDNGKSFSDTGRIAYGTVKRLGSDYIEYDVSLDGVTSSRFLCLLSQCQYTRFDVEDKEMKVGSINDVAIGDTILILSTYGVIKDMIIFK